MKTVAKKVRSKTHTALQKPKAKIVARKKNLLATDPFFSSLPVDLGQTNNTIIDRTLYGKKGA